MAEPWNQELVQSIERIKGKKDYYSVAAAKRNVLQVIAEFHGFRSSMSCGTEIWKRSTRFGQFEQLHILGAEF